MHRDIFSPDYFAARERFRSAARSAGAELRSHPIAAPGPRGETLTMDIATLGESSSPRALLLSSGLHGVEGFAGSAVQAAWLESYAAGQALPAGTRVALVHALNPYGFAWRRRANEHNVDLNRNFLGEQPYAGAPAEVQALERFIAPASPPEPAWLAWRFWPQAALIVARHGMETLRRALAQGQYEYPQGLFYGGQGPEETMRIVGEYFSGWTGEAAFVLHIDLHTGLGPCGRCTLLAGSAPQHAPWLRSRFPKTPVEAAAAGLNTAVSGGMGDWLSARLAAEGKRHIFATAEFGTCGALRAFRALREENRAHRFPHAHGHEAARRRLVRCFCPADTARRRQVLDQGLALMAQGLSACGDKKHGNHDHIIYV